MIKVFAADDSEFVGDSLTELLGQNCEVDVGGWSGGAEVAIRRLKPDVVVLDIRMPGGGGTPAQIDNAALFGSLERSRFELALAYDATIEGWARALDMRDRQTEGHTVRITETTLRLARAMGIPEAELVHIRRGALLHDVGKMSIPDRILLKTGTLTAEQWALMRREPEWAYELLSPIAYLRPALDIPYCRHEKWDGTGYPRGLKGDQIPLAARIFAVVDAWDSLLSKRPYRPAWPEEQVRDYLRGQSGKHFDPRVTELYFALEASRHALEDNTCPQ